MTEPTATLRRASLGTLFLTVFLDLLGFGLVVPFLPGVARSFGAGDFVATLLGASYSLMQFLFVPVWGRLSDRVGRRPLLLWSIAAGVVGWILLGLANSLVLLFAARLWSGLATANIAVAQAYIADITSPAERSRGMGLIGMAFGLGFIFGPLIGGELGQFEVLGRPGALAAFVAAALAAVNLVLAFVNLPESLPADARGRPGGAPRRGLGLEALRAAVKVPGVGIALLINFQVVFWFAGMEQTFRLFTDDGFHMTVAGTGRVLGFVGVVAVIVQGGLIGSLTRAFGEARLIRTGALVLAFSFALLGASPDIGSGARLLLFASSGLLALGSGLATPSVASYVSQRSGGMQGTALGALQSASALARALGPAMGGILYQGIGRSAPYFVGAVGMALAALLALGLSPRPAAPA